MSDPKVYPASRATKKRMLNIPGWIFWVVSVLVAVVGAWAIWYGMQDRPIDAPLPPAQNMVAGPHQKPVGPDGKSVVRVKGVDDGTSSDDEGWTDAADAGEGGAEHVNGKDLDVSSSTMRGMSVFIPSRGIYSPIRGTHTFVHSKYRNFNTILIPSNPLRSSWYDKGGPLAGGTEGTTTVVGHVAYHGQWGALHDLAYVPLGATVWTKDAAGHAQRWQVTRVYYLPHTQYPQEYWNAKGVRQLVLATCGGKVVGKGYTQNVFVIAKPVAS